MNRNTENNQGRANKSFNYAQAARSSQTRGPLQEPVLPQQQQQTEPSILRKTTSSSSFNSSSIGQHKNTYGFYKYKKKKILLFGKHHLNSS